MVHHRWHPPRGSSCQCSSSTASAAWGHPRLAHGRVPVPRNAYRSLRGPRGAVPVHRPLCQCHRRASRVHGTGHGGRGARPQNVRSQRWPAGRTRPTCNSSGAARSCRRQWHTSRGARGPGCRCRSRQARGRQGVPTDATRGTACGVGGEEGQGGQWGQRGPGRRLVGHGEPRVVGHLAHGGPSGGVRVQHVGQQGQQLVRPGAATHCRGRRGEETT